MRTFAQAFVSSYVQKFWPDVSVANADQGIELRRGDDRFVIRLQSVSRDDAARWRRETAYLIDMWALVGRGGR